MLVVYQDCDLKRLGDSLFVRDVRRIYRVEFVCVSWNGFSVRCDSLVALRHGYTVDVHWRNVHGRATGTIEDYQKEISMRLTCLVFIIYLYYDIISSLQSMLL